jgi:hypothetical protein
MELLILGLLYMELDPTLVSVTVVLFKVLRLSYEYFLLNSGFSFSFNVFDKLEDDVSSLGLLIYLAELDFTIVLGPTSKLDCRSAFDAPL